MFHIQSTTSHFNKPIQVLCKMQIHESHSTTVMCPKCDNVKVIDLLVPIIS